MEEAITGVQKSFGMSVCDGSDKIDVTAQSHIILLSGLFYGKEQVVVKGKIGFNVEHGCVMMVAVRSLSSQISNAVLQCIS